MSRQPTVFVVDDDLEARQSLCWLLQQADVAVRAFASGEEFLDSLHPQEAGCVVLDIRMPGLGGLEVQQRLRERGIDLPIIFLTAYGDVPACTKAFKAGAADFLEKPVDDRLLLERVQGALHSAWPRNKPATHTEFSDRLETLTPREREVLDLLVCGRSLKEIARHLGVSFQTAWRHQLRVLSKMNVPSDLELVRLATQQSYRPQFGQS